MRKLLYLTVPLLAALFSGCSGGGGNDAGPITARDAGPDAGGTSGGGFTTQDLDLGAGGVGPNDFVTAALAPDGRIGIAYYWDLDEAHKRLEYLEVETDGTTRGVTLVQSVQRFSQISLIFDPSGNAYVAYLGNDPNVEELIEANAPDGGLFWTESDLAIATITPAGTLTTEYAVHNGNENALCSANDPVDDRDSEVVGLSPALVYDGNQIVGVYRNIHAGQFPVQDYASSTLDSIIGSTGNWTKIPAICGADNGGFFVHVGVGEGSSITALNGQVTVLTGGATDLDATIQGLFTASYDGTGWTLADGGGKEALFTTQALAPNDGSGPSIASDAVAGFGISWVDMTSSILYYANSADGRGYSGYEDVFGSGTGGWYPSLAFDPTLHSPVVAFYVCSQEPGVNICPPQEDELRVAVRKPNTTWEPTTVDAEGGQYPTLLFNGGQMVVVYRTIPAGGLRIAKQVAP